jgi:hypothetical protein
MDADEAENAEEPDAAPSRGVALSAASGIGVGLTLSRRTEIALYLPWSEASHSASDLRARFNPPALALRFQSLSKCHSRFCSEVKLQSELDVSRIVEASH